MSDQSVVSRHISTSDGLVYWQLNLNRELKKKKINTKKKRDHGAALMLTKTAWSQRQEETSVLRQAPT